MMGKLKVLFISAEVAPLAKVGGLADVVGALPLALNDLDIDARVIMPLYKGIRDRYADKLEFMRWSMIKMGWRTVYSGLFKMEVNGVIHYFIDNEQYFGHDQVYLRYDFDIERFSFFQLAVLETMGMSMDFYPDVLHCNDWQTGLIPCMLKAHYQSQGYFSELKTVYTIHNLKYQGVHGYEQIADYTSLTPEYMNEFGVLFKGVPNMMKAGIVYADAITTVSPTYANEILTSYFGEGLDQVLQNYQYKLQGIINGIDANQYDPTKDDLIYQTYDADTYVEGKNANKLALQAELGLPIDAELPLLSMVTRLVDQKGLDLLLAIIDEMIDIPVQLVVLGTGDPNYEQALAAVAGRYTDRLRVCLAYDNRLAHCLYAGSDFFLMPSLFEPCGLSQLISMAYGTVPIVRETGGLADTVIAYNKYTGSGNGFSFANINAHELLFTTKDAVTLYRDHNNSFRDLQKVGMLGNYSWQNSARRYSEIYNDICHQTYDMI